MVMAAAAASSGDAPGAVEGADVVLDGAVGTMYTGTSTGSLALSIRDEPVVRDGSTSSSRDVGLAADDSA